MANETQAPVKSELLLDRYQVESLLGEGGLGTVVKALDTRLRRPVAIKTLKRSLAATESDTYRAAEERFVREAEAGSRLGSHPNVVIVYDFVGGPDQTFYLILEFAPGGTIADRLKHGPLPLSASLRLMADVARGLFVTHEVGIVHRDIKPANIFLTADGRAQIGDFGIAQMDNLSARTSLSIGHPGTPLYMSPEQAGTTGYLRPESDQYSTGLVLFEAVTGKAYKRMRQRDAEQLMADLPPQLVAVIQRMLAPDPDDRYMTMRDVEEELLKIRQLLEVSPPPVRPEAERLPELTQEAARPPSTPATPALSPPPLTPPERDTPRLAVAPEQVVAPIEPRPTPSDVPTPGPSLIPRTEVAPAQSEPPPAVIAPVSPVPPDGTIAEAARPVVTASAASATEVGRTRGAADVAPRAVEQPVVVAPRVADAVGTQQPRHLVRNAAIALAAVAFLGVIGLMTFLRGGGGGGEKIATATVQSSLGGAGVTPIGVSPTPGSDAQTTPNAGGSPAIAGPLSNPIVTPTTAPATPTTVPPTATPKPTLGVFGVGATRRNDLATLTSADASDTFTTGENVYAYINYDGAQPGIDAFEVTVVADGTPRVLSPVVVQKPGGFVYVSLGSFPPSKVRIEVRHNGTLIGSQPEITINAPPTATPIPPTPVPAPVRVPQTQPQTQPQQPVTQPRAPTCAPGTC